MDFASSSAEPASATEPDATTVLVVDDDRAVIEALTELLESEGYDVVAARDGGAALNRLRAGLRPAVILLDLMMPGMDGIEFRQRQLADSRLASIPVVVMSARPDVALQAKQLLVTDYLPKPMSFDDLLHAVQNCAITVVT